MYYIEGETIRYGLDACARSVSCYNKLTSHEYILNPGNVWKLIYSMPGTERVEVPVWADEQHPVITASADELTVSYDGLIGDEGLKIDALLTLHFKVNELGLQVTADLENRDPAVVLQELQLTPVSGARSLSGKPSDDYLAWPRDMGIKVRNPAYRDLSTFAGFRKYERHDQFHTDMDALYQGTSACMQWYDWYNEDEGLYVGSEDTTHQAVCLHAERDVKLNVLRFGFIRYPMLNAGEKWSGQAIDIYPHLGDWHTGAKIYRAWSEESGSFKAPEIPLWAQDMTGWLRVILKQHHCELNWDFHDIPRLYDEAEAAGFDTLYLLGWEKGGFARLWPDFEIDDRMGGEKLLKEGIDYVHAKGGKVLMFLSYALIDHQSLFYRKEGGNKATIRSIWNEDIPFAETYCGEGTYRKIGNPAMPMYLACPGSPLWQEKMKAVGKVCLDAGADGVLYDIGGMKPFFCYSTEHTHQKPSHSHENKADNYRGLREYVKSFGEDKIILMEHNVDIYGQHMDIAHSCGTVPSAWLLDPATAGDVEREKDDQKLQSMYRYTFPELIVTNRECGEDENHYKANVGYSYLMGMRFDMTIYRCCGSLSDLPNYAKYLKEVTDLQHAYADFFLRGRFVDTDGFVSDNPKVQAKGWLGVNGGFAVSLWNPTGEDQAVTLTDENGVSIETVVPAEKVGAVCFD